MGLTKAAARLSLLLRTRGKTKMVRTALLRAGNAVARALAQANSPSFAPLQGGEKVFAARALAATKWSRDYATNSHDHFNIHRPGPTDSDPFDFSAENYKRSAVIPLLTLAQTQNDGFLSLNAMNKVA